MREADGARVCCAQLGPLLELHTPDSHQSTNGEEGRPDAHPVAIGQLEPSRISMPKMQARPDPLLTRSSEGIRAGHSVDSGTLVRLWLQGRLHQPPPADRWLRRPPIPPPESRSECTSPTVPVRLSSRRGARKVGVDWQEGGGGGDGTFDLKNNRVPGAIFFVTGTEVQIRRAATMMVHIGMLVRARRAVPCRARGSGYLGLL